MVLAAWRNKQRIEQERMALEEMPIASLTALTANINRDDSKRKEPFGIVDFLLFADSDRESKGLLAAKTAETMLDLRRQYRLPDYMLAAWGEVVKSARAGTKLPECKALADETSTIWIINPRIKQRGIHCGLIGVHGVWQGTVRVADIDRPLIFYDVILPNRKAAGWFAYDTWLPLAT